MAFNEQKLNYKKKPGKIYCSTFRGHHDPIIKRLVKKHARKERYNIFFSVNISVALKEEFPMELTCELELSEFCWLPCVVELQCIQCSKSQIILSMLINSFPVLFGGSEILNRL